MLDKVKPEELAQKTTLHTLGKVTVLKGSHQVRGHFTKWSTYVYPGCYFFIFGQEYAYRVADVVDNFNLNLTAPYEGDNVYESVYLMFRPPKQWFNISCDKDVIAADNVDAVAFDLPIGTHVAITCVSGTVRRYEIVSDVPYLFKTDVPGIYNLSFKKPGYHMAQKAITAEVK